MTPLTDRVGELFDAQRRKKREIISPEGVPLRVLVADNGERVAAFAIDIILMTLMVFTLYLFAGYLFVDGGGQGVGVTLVLFLAFIVRNLYFLHFELTWQGRTPGKKICNLRVVNRKGGELTPSAVIARNLTREVEFFLPLSLFFSAALSLFSLESMAIFGWVLAIALLPFVNRDHLRAGDLIAGTQVISIPKRVLLPDLADEGKNEAFGDSYRFSHRQLSVYGAFELQVLEELLRRPPDPETSRILREVCEKIRTKIGWEEEVPLHKTRSFLTQFYAAERADLERGQLFGKLRLDKNGEAQKGKGRNGA